MSTRDPARQPVPAQRSRLSLAALPQLAAGVVRPAFDPATLRVGVVHFGPGAFHRAHQAAYLDTLAALDPRWGICAVSLHSSGVRDALVPQDSLYTLAVLDQTIGHRVIGSLRELLVAPESPEAVFQRLQAPAVQVVTTTVTEKGYCLGPDGRLDLQHPDIAHDLAQPRAPVSLLGYLVEGLRRRHAAGVAPFVLIPCDNLPHNGTSLKAAVLQLAGLGAPALASGLRDALQCPNTMVDAITPATDAALRQRTAAATGLQDAWPVQREAFSQWVIERHPHPGGPDWAAAGATLTDSVAAFERAKLRLLNGPHSMLAYAGLLRGHQTVGQAMADPALAAAVRRYMRDDVLPLLADEQRPAGLDLHAYCEAILARFGNPAIQHALAQIACDGSQKLPVRIIAPLQEALARGRDPGGFAVPLAAWLRFIRVRTLAGQAIVDPLADELAALARRMTDSPGDVPAALALRSVFPAHLAGDARLVQALQAAYGSLLGDATPLQP